jgi:hypothetical protein
MEAELAGVVEVAVEQEKALVVEGEEDSGALQALVLLLGDVDGVALELAGQMADLGGIEGFPELVAHLEALLAEGDEDGVGVVIDELEVASGGLEAEVEKILGFQLVHWSFREVIEDVFLVRGSLVVPVVALEVVLDRIEAERIGRV